MLWLKFAGWFQVRLTTDPDPTDEPRGVSGYAQAIAGEPDLDRVIRLQPGPQVVPRSHCPEVGVMVRAVYADGKNVTGHALVDAAVELVGDPKFEGRNGIVAEDGFEPVVPCHFQIKKNRFVLNRPHLDTEEFPFEELKAGGVNGSPAEIAEATGIWDLGTVWEKREAELRKDRDATTDPVVQAALTQRIEMIANRKKNRLTRYFGARMMYALSLKGTAACEDPDGFLKGTVDLISPWPVEFWFGGWDPDAFSGFMQGFIGVPIETTVPTDDNELALSLAKLMDVDSPRRA